MGWGFKKQPHKRQALKQHNFKVRLRKYEKGRWAELAQDRFQ